MATTLKICIESLDPKGRLTRNLSGTCNKVSDTGPSWSSCFYIFNLDFLARQSRRPGALAELI